MFARYRRYGAASGRCCQTARVSARAGNHRPLILAAWHDTPAMAKILRLADHIEWAAKHESLEAIGKFLRELREKDWYHIGD